MGGLCQSGLTVARKRGEGVGCVWCREYVAFLPLSQRMGI